MNNNMKIGSKEIYLMMLVAYVFSFMIRMIWIYQVQDNPNYFWDNEIMISTGDGYYFASGAQKWLEGTLAYNPRVPDLFYTATITLSAYVAKYTHYSLNTVILYMPSIISSLVVIPIILIGRLFGLTLVGFFAALLGSIAWSYYNRTMVGYFDTDMFSAMAPMFILYFLLATIKTERGYFILLSALAFLIYPFLYDQGKTIIYVMGMLYMGYMLLFHRKDEFTYRSILLLMIGLVSFNFWLQMGLILVVYIALEKSLLSTKHAIIGSLLFVPIFIYTGNIHGLLIDKVGYYFDRGTQEHGLKFLQVQQTIREAGIIPFDVMAERISGSVVGALAAFVGYILLVLRHREFILALPLIGIALFSLIGGLRFTVYAVPMAAISAIYLFDYLANLLENKKLSVIVLALLSAAIIYPNIAHIVDYRVSTVMSKSEVMALDKLKTVSSSKDYVVAWWDYGYPIWYFADKNTLIDGGKHDNDNFIVSQVMLSTSPIESARLSRIAVEEYVSSNYQRITDTLFKNNTPTPINVESFLEELRYSDEYKMPPKTRNVYLYMPWNMMGILPTVKRFSETDLNTGELLGRNFFYLAQRYQKDENGINFGEGIYFLPNEGKIQIGDQKVEIGQYIVVGYDEDNKIKTQHQTLNYQANFHLVHMVNYDSYLILDDDYLNSTFIQMFVFENYDKNLFEPVVLDPMTKIYKLKI